METVWEEHSLVALQILWGGLKKWFSNKWNSIIKNSQNIYEILKHLVL